MQRVKRVIENGGENMTTLLNQGQALGEFEILAVAGIGGMGVVYRSRQRTLDRVVALKVIREEIAENTEYRERFMREAHLAASVDHPNIVSVFDVGEFGGRLALAMQWVQGENLREALRASGGMAPDRAVRVLSQMGGALDAIHGVGLVHRDIKPSNVLIRNVGGSDHAYLTDFGVAKRSDTVADLTATGMVVGTVDYMAPEQISGGHTDARTDVYALGCVFYELLSGRVPYERENSVAKLFAHVSDPPPRLQGPLAQLYPAFEPVLEKAMAKNPADRYMSAGDFARDATAALQGTRYTGAPSVVGVGEAKPGAGSKAKTVHGPAQLEALRQALTAPHADPRGDTGYSPPPTAPTAPAPPSPQQGGPAYEPTAVEHRAPPSSPYPTQPQPYPPQYPTYGYGAPPPTQPPPTRKSNPLPLILLAIVAVAGVAAGVLAALGLFSSNSPAPTPPVTTQVKQHHKGGTRTTPHTAPVPAAPVTASGSPVRPCDQNISANEVTTCPFADNVFRSYAHAYKSNGGAANESVGAFSPATGRTYVMSCRNNSGRISCTGGNHAFVTFPLHAAQVF